VRAKTCADQGTRSAAAPRGVITTLKGRGVCRVCGLPGDSIKGSDWVQLKLSSWVAEPR
jgi:hypothetical protein